MSRLTIFEEDGEAVVNLDHFDDIHRELGLIGVRFERWQASRQLAANASQDEILDAYRDAIAALVAESGFQSVDVISVNADTPELPAIRDKFLHEHRHAEFEVRFFVDGEGLFFIRDAGRVYAALCTRGDLISVPAGVRHWFDLGPSPQLKAIRLFTTPDGWVAKFTGDPIADRFPRIDADAFMARAA